MYQWRRGTRELEDGQGLTGSQTAELRIDSPCEYNDGYYTVVVSSACCDATSREATLELLPWGWDADADFEVSMTDLNAVLANFGRAGSPGGPGDGNLDGVVDFDDLNAVVGNFGAGICVP